jgi:hypothetical protein
MPISSADLDAWNIAEGNINGKPSLVRFRPNLENHLGDSAYPRRLTITWEYGEDNSSGMPSSTQSDEMKCFEDAIIAALDPERLAILSFTFTNAGIREWHFYVNEVSTVGNKINAVLANFQKLPISLQVEDDPNWDELRHVFLKCK